MLSIFSFSSFSVSFLKFPLQAAVIDGVDKGEKKRDREIRMRPDILGVAFLFSGVVSFNGGLWQVSRRYEKITLKKQHLNIAKPPLTALPKDDDDPDEYLFRRVELSGTFDNEGTELVGPRGVPSYKGQTNSEEARGGYILMTPFQIKDTDDIVMVNRGFVPIDAGKHRMYRSLYTGEGFTEAKVSGLLRKEEFMTTTTGIGVNELNFKPIMEGFSWICMRPYEMTKLYYRRRWGEENVEKRSKKHGLHRFHIEMVEDFSGNDQRMVRDRAWPKRRDLDEITYISMAPLVHACYAAFWFFIAGGSVIGIRHSYKLAHQIIADNQKRIMSMNVAQKVRDKNAEAFAAAQREVEALKKASKDSVNK
jgi:hypothetical protein